MSGIANAPLFLPYLHGSTTDWVANGVLTRGPRSWTAVQDRGQRSTIEELMRKILNFVYHHQSRMARLLMEPANITIHNVQHRKKTKHKIVYIA